MNPILKTQISARKIKTKFMSLALTGVLTLGLLAGCAQIPVETVTGSGAQSAETVLAATTTAQDGGAAVVAAQAFEFDAEDDLTTWDDAGATRVTLKGSDISLEGQGAAVDGGTLRITAAGTYVISGSLENGQIVVNVGSDEEVRLVLNGVTITNQGAPAIFIEEAARAYVTLAEGTFNTLTMSASATAKGAGEGAAVAATAEAQAETITEADDTPDAALFSKGDLTLNGSGTLAVNGTAKHGIVSKDDLRIAGGSYVITAASDAVRGKDLIAIKDGSFEIVAGADAFQSSNAEDADKGFILIESGSFQVRADADGFQAETALVIKDGDFEVETGGGSVNSVQKTSAGGKEWSGERPAMGTRPDRGTPSAGGFPGAAAGTAAEPSANTSASVEAEKADGIDDADDTADAFSAKGLKAGAAIVVSGGTFAMDSADDGVHSNGSIEIQGGTFEIESGDDGIHGDVSVLILDGEMEILKSFEGIEGSEVTVRGGTIGILSGDDGINTSGDNGLLVEGGFVSVNAEGDGIDLNGSGAMTGGTLLVHGPTGSGNGALDYSGDFVQSGGLLVAAGSSGMAQSPSASSTELSAQIFLTSQAAGTLVRVEAEDGTVIAAFRPSKAFSSLVLASPEFAFGESYHVYVGGSSSGEEVNGLVTGGAVEGGTEVVSFEISGSVTQAVQEGAAAGGMGGGMKR